MRTHISKRSSTKAERLFAEILKRNHIPFIHRKMIDGREIDFIVGKYAIEIDGHEQKVQRNQWILSKGFTPLHYSNHALRTNSSEVEKDIIVKYGIHT